MKEERSSIPRLIQEAGGLQDGTAREVARQTGVPEAEVFGVGSFFHLISDPLTKVRICTGLSCQLAGADELLEAARSSGLEARSCFCLAACDVGPAVLHERRLLPAVTVRDVERAGGDHTQLLSRAVPDLETWRGAVGPEDADPDRLAIHLGGVPDFSGGAFATAEERGPAAVIAELEKAGLQGRGGAGFPAHIKWSSIRNQNEETRYVVLNGDEGEPGTFKDREVMIRRPDLVLEGLAIAARAIGARNVYLYLRGEFDRPLRVLAGAIERVSAAGLFEDVHFHIHEGQGAYICGEETALLEALEGRRGLPRLKPPYPTECGLWGKPTLIQNVETIACIPSIMLRGGDWFRALGLQEAGTKLYCVSGHVKTPGTYEMPLGATLDQLLEVAGGCTGTLKAFCPGGASSGFLPASKSDLPLDFGSLAKAGSMLGSAGVVVLNQTVDMRQAARELLRFFEEESCGQCAPCRIGTRYLRECVDRNRRETSSAVDRPAELQHAADAAWQMNEGSICGLGQAAPLPLMSALQYFPEEFRS